MISDKPSIILIKIVINEQNIKKYIIYNLGIQKILNILKNKITKI
jgi:hypothetical protein